MKKHLLFAFFFVFVSSLAQQPKAQIKVNARAQKDKILLRWAIDSPIEWQKAHKTGFIVTRFTIKRNGKPASSLEKKILTSTPLLPAPLETWMDLIQRDNNAAIIAQSIYGESFEVGGAKEGALSKIVSVAEELDQRYTFALYAADMSFEGAMKAGWGFADLTAKKNEEYAYQVSLAGKTRVLPSSYVIGLKDFTELPAPTDFIAVPEDRQVLLSWDYETFKTIYSSFMVEKSEDGLNFLPISTTPLVNLNDRPEHPSKRMYHIDTLSINDKAYHYRIYGISSFGEKGKISASMAVQGIKSISIAPRVSDYVISDPQTAVIEWEYPLESEKDLQGFDVDIAEQDKGPYQKIGERLPPNARKIKYDKLQVSNYVRVTAIGKNNQRLTSQSMLIQPIDSIAPMKPQGLEGKIDSLGIVRLQWKANLEKDMLGYRVLRANNESEEFVDIRGKPFTALAYKDSVSLAMTNKKVYYRIMAEDRRHNLSLPSEIVIIEKPEKVAPTAPIFKDFDSKNGKVSLKWIRSYSDDVASYSLKRREKGQAKWEELEQFQDTIQAYTDEKAEKNKIYEYAILAKDKSNLWSSIEYSTITVQVQDFRPIAILKNVEAVADRVNKKIILSWEYENGNEKVASLSIYKNVKGEQPALWKEIPATIRTLEDKALKMNLDYEYQLVPSVASNSPAKAVLINVKY